MGGPCPQSTVSSSGVRAVLRHARGPIGASSVVVRRRHFATVLGFSPYWAARVRDDARAAWSSARTRGVMRALPWRPLPGVPPRPADRRMHHPTSGLYAWPASADTSRILRTRRVAERWPRQVGARLVVRPAARSRCPPFACPSRSLPPQPRAPYQFCPTVTVRTSCRSRMGRSDIPAASGVPLLAGGAHPAPDPTGKGRRRGVCDARGAPAAYDLDGCHKPPVRVPSGCATHDWLLAAGTKR